MSRSIGEYLSERLRLLREWRSLAEKVAVIARELIPGAEIYVFGSAVTGRIAGSSDIDILVIVPGNYSEREVHTYLAIKLEEVLGTLSYILDLHVVRKENVNKPPYMWWLGKSVKIG